MEATEMQFRHIVGVTTFAILITSANTSNSSIRVHIESDQAKCVEAKSWNDLLICTFPISWKAGASPNPNGPDGAFPLNEWNTNSIIGMKNTHKESSYVLYTADEVYSRDQTYHRSELYNIADVDHRINIKSNEIAAVSARVGAIENNINKEVISAIRDLPKGLMDSEMEARLVRSVIAELDPKIRQMLDAMKQELIAELKR